MRSPLIKYSLIILFAYIAGMLINGIILNNYFTDVVTQEPNHTLQALFHPLNFLILSAVGSYLHWKYVGHKQVRILSGQATKQLNIVTVSAMIGFLLGTISFTTIVIQAARHELLFGLFIFVLPGVSILSAVLGAGTGIGIALFLKRKKIKSVFSAK
jgi:hypothetical protein